jgi:hypothetical protein
MLHAIQWFEIPAEDLERAVHFYATVLDIPLKIVEMFPGFHMAQFPSDPGAIGGAIVSGDGYAPNANGTIVYLSCGDDLSVALGKVEEAGGKVVMPKENVGEFGYSAQFLDTEGNRVGLYSLH